VTVMVEGRSRSLPAGLTIAQVLERLELPAMAGDLLAVDHSMLRKGAYPPPQGFRRSCVVSGSPESKGEWRTGSLVPGWASGR